MSSILVVNAGSTSLKLSLVEFQFDRDVLWVDDDLEGQGAGSFVGPVEHHNYMVNTLSQALAALGRPAQVLRMRVRGGCDEDGVDGGRVKHLVQGAGRPCAVGRGQGPGPA